MDEIPDAEYKVVEHQIASPLDPSPRWRFQRLARGTGSGLDDASSATPSRAQMYRPTPFGGTDIIVCEQRLRHTAIEQRFANVFNRSINHFRVTQRCYVDVLRRLAERAI